MENEKKYQVVIAGAGPGGTLLARELAAAGISVAIFEMKKEGTPAHNWSDAVEINALEAAGFEMPVAAGGSFSGRLVKKDETDDNLFEKHVINPLQIWAPDLSCKTRTDVDFRYITTDRVVLGRMLTEQAVAAGAEIFYDHRAERLIGETGGDLKNISVHGLRVTDLTEKKSFDVTADVVVDATGYFSSLRTGLSDHTAIGRKFEKGDLAYACRTVRKLDRQKAAADNLTDHYRYGAFKGYFWTHKHSEDSIDVGGGVREEPSRVDPYTIIDEMIAQRPSITDVELRRGGGIVMVGRSPYSLAASGFLAVGDAAGQVIPTTGCGVGGALTGALIAAETIKAAIAQGNCRIESLWGYNRKWFAGPGRGSHFAALAALKEILQDLSHEDLAFLVKQDILSGEMLTPSINGIFYVPDIRTMVLTLFRGISRPSLLMKLNQATSAGKKIFSHYQKYPDTWDPKVFGRWVQTAEKLFGGIAA